ncbi:hypothetical protein GB931_16600 [Modestobacter sp. I12A-02628]|uniref:Flagellar protein FliT n=1 Tax=Goekera deserti TaxID=2497753 RepID=A0A7K3WGB9_9ACTN|nr:hypothetical protein [Goekera deserti]MPQ99505.1 hypothetical protein [Goekera deserti]NDI48992.1 hypothetical protein [Goekera deserti]NEL55538.1 hypothetical protein [Goekera deserti]
MSLDRRSPGVGTPADSWPDVLDVLEGELIDAQRAIAGVDTDAIVEWGRRMTDWIPPNALGPVPDDLRERAARLLQHQLAVAEEIVERITQSKKQRDVAARMAYAPSRPIAAFIDRPI